MFLCIILSLVSGNLFSQTKVKSFRIYLLLFVDQTGEDDEACDTLKPCDMHYTNPVTFMVLILKIILRLSTKPALVSVDNELARES